MDYIFNKKPTIIVETFDNDFDIIVVPEQMTFDEIKDQLNKLYPIGYKSVTLGQTVGCFTKALRRKIENNNK